MTMCNLCHDRPVMQAVGNGELRQVSCPNPECDNKIEVMTMKAIAQGEYQLYSVKYGNHPAITIKAHGLERAVINAWVRIAYRYGWAKREDFIRDSVVKEKR